MFFVTDLWFHLNIVLLGPPLVSRLFPSAPGWDLQGVCLDTFPPQMWPWTYHRELNRTSDQSAGVSAHHAAVAPGSVDRLDAGAPGCSAASSSAGGGRRAARGEAADGPRWRSDRVPVAEHRRTGWKRPGRSCRGTRSPEESRSERVKQQEENTGSDPLVYRNSLK